MAQVLSGSFNTTAYSNRYVTFSWTATQDVSANTTTISWTIKGGGSQTQYMMAAPFKVVIAGDTVYESDTRIKLSNGTVIKSGTKTLTHNTDGTKSFTASVSAAIYSYSVNCSGSQTWELQTIPRKATITAAPHFNDLNNATVTYSNPAGTAVTKLELGVFNEDANQSLAPYREVSKTETSYTFQFTAAERDNLRNYTPNSNTATVKFYIRTTIGGETYLHSVSRTLTITDANPEISVFIDEREQDNYETAGAGVFIRYCSLLYVSVNAAAKKGATLTGCSITNSGNTTDYWEETFVNPTDSVVTCVVTDSRGNSTTQVIDLANNALGYSWVPYVTLSCSMSASLALDTSTTSKAKITASGDYYNNSIGKTRNSLVITYNIWEEGSDTVAYTGTISNVSYNGNKYSATIDVPGLDYQKTYRFQCWARDALMRKYSDEMSLSTLPIFDWSKEDFNFNVPVSFSGSPMVDFVIEQGTTSMGSNGTWYWQKWASGRAECYGLRNYGNMGISSAWGSLYTSSAFTQSLPSGLFSSAPECCNIIYAGSSSDWAAFIVPRLSANTTTSCGFYVARPTTGTITQAKISFHILGRWK